MDLQALITLLDVPGVGIVRAKKLIDRFGSPENVLNASVKELQTVADIGPGTAAAFAGADSKSAEHQLNIMCDYGAAAITFWDDNYPPLLKEVYDPPLILFVDGDADVLTKKSVGVVGTRNPSQYGRNQTRAIVSELAKEGYSIVSGMARGIDSEAHKAALDNGGPTVAVLGCGLDVVYPRENKDLKRRIAENGAVVSEFPFETPPEARNFPRRNRIISGLSLGTLIIEAGYKSGALITAAYASDQNREVFALPADVTRAQGSGCNRLIRKSTAALVTTAADIIESLGGSADKGKQSALFEIPPDLKGARLEVYNCLDNGPVYIDEIALKLKKNTSEILTILLDLEMDDHVKSLPGKNYVRA